MIRVLYILYFILYIFIFLAHWLAVRGPSIASFIYTCFIALLLSWSLFICGFVTLLYSFEFYLCLCRLYYEYDIYEIIIIILCLYYICTMTSSISYTSFDHIWINRMWNKWINEKGYVNVRIYFQQWHGAFCWGQPVTWPDVWFNPIPLSQPGSGKLPSVEDTHTTPNNWEVNLSLLFII
jgi:hypothetical protein